MKGWGVMIQPVEMKWLAEFSDCTPLLQQMHCTALLGLPGTARIHVIGSVHFKGVYP